MISNGHVPSNLERKAAHLLDTGEINYIQEYSFSDLKSDKGVLLRFDFAVFESQEDIDNNRRPKFVLEMQGSQHYSQKFQTAEAFRRQQMNDKRKRAYCAAKHITLVEVPYTEYNNMTLESLLEAGRFFE